MSATNRALGPPVALKTTGRTRATRSTKPNGLLPLPRVSREIHASGRELKRPQPSKPSETP
jgi:hypothetical protein